MIKGSGIKRIVAGMFLTLFTLYYANATLFEHCHLINGVTIVHSHFHFDSHHSTSAGGHDRPSLALIDSLDNLVCIGIEQILCRLAAYSFLCGIVAGLPESKPVSVCNTDYFLRAPPALR